MKPFKTRSKPILKNVVISCCGEFNLKILKEKPILKSIRIKAHLNISIMYSLGINVLTNKKKIISKILLKIRSICNASKFHNYHLVKVSQKRFHI
jgi:hypothetical protein